MPPPYADMDREQFRTGNRGHARSPAEYRWERWLAVHDRERGRLTSDGRILPGSCRDARFELLRERCEAFAAKTADAFDHFG